MLRRRELLTSATVATAGALASGHAPAVESTSSVDEAFHFISRSMELQLSAVAPRFLSLNVDGLAKGRRAASIIGGQNKNGGYKAPSSLSGGVHRVEYRNTAAANDSPSVWALEFSGNRIVLTSEWCADFEPPPMDFQ